MGNAAYVSRGFRRFLDRLKTYGLESFGLYYGVYRAEVVDNTGFEAAPGTAVPGTSTEGKDRQGLLKVRVPAVGDGPKTPPRTAYPIAPLAGNDYGGKSLPPAGGHCYVMFENGKPDIPLWIGGWWGLGELPAEMNNTTRHGFKTPGGHSVLFSDDPNNRFVRITWHDDDSGQDQFSFIELTKDGGIAMSNKNGSSLFLNAEDKSVLMVSEQGHSISMTADAVTIADKDGNVVSLDRGAVTVLSAGTVNVRGPTVNLGAGAVFLGDVPAFKAVLGELLLTWLATHTHPVPGAGTSLPPAVPPLPTMLSESVRLKR